MTYLFCKLLLKFLSLLCENIAQLLTFIHHFLFFVGAFAGTQKGTQDWLLALTPEGEGSNPPWDQIACKVSQSQLLTLKADGSHPPWDLVL